MTMKRLNYFALLLVFLMAMPVSSLQAKCSGLTEDDLFFLCMEQTGLSSLTVALCLGFSDTQAINQRRFRIKRKLSEV